MQDYSVDDILKEVRVVLDQNMDGKALASLGDSDTLTLDEIIRNTMTDAATTIEELAPLDMLDDGVDALKEDSDYSVTWQKQKNGSDIFDGSVRLPDNFMRIVSFKMSDWNYSVHEAVPMESPLYIRLQSQFSGIGGTPIKPYVAIDNAQGKLEFYSSKHVQDGKSASVQVFKYLPLPSIKGDKISLCPKLHRAIVYANASLSAAVYSSTEQMQILMSMAHRFAHILTNEKQN